MTPKLCYLETLEREGIELEKNYEATTVKFEINFPGPGQQLGVLCADSLATYLRLRLSTLV